MTLAVKVALNPSTTNQLKTNSIIYANFKSLFANASNLDKSKILQCGIESNYMYEALKCHAHQISIQCRSEQEQ